jgi:hypothetical protein
MAYAVRSRYQEIGVGLTPRLLHALWHRSAQTLLRIETHGVCRAQSLPRNWCGADAPAFASSLASQCTDLTPD